EHLVVGSDEGHVLQVLRKAGPNTFEVIHKYSLPDGEETARTKKQDPEIDIEGMAADGNNVYVVGSHSRKRSKVEARNPKRRWRWENRKRLSQHEPDDARQALLRIALDRNGARTGEIECADLWGAIHKFDVLRPFAAIPSKENGIDIEGIAAYDGRLYIGFRGPVLRENWVPVLVTRFDDIVGQATLRYVNLGGLGIRDMVAVDDQCLLLIAGPVGDGPGGYHLYRWNGGDCVPGQNGARGVVEHIAEIPTTGEAKAEGLTLLESDREDALRMLILFDGPEDGDPVAYRLRR
ncbi:MAG: DUF3616 domain-containing protein, partial [Planctomycetota bacterium]